MIYYFGNIKKLKDTSYMIENCDESNYWTHEYNCKLNISLPFMNRNFNFFDLTNINDKKLLDVIENIKNLPDKEINVFAKIAQAHKVTDAFILLPDKDLDEYYGYYAEDKKTIQPNSGREVLFKIYEQHGIKWCFYRH